MMRTKRWEIVALAAFGLAASGCATQPMPAPGIWSDDPTRSPVTAIPAGRQWRMGPEGLQLTKASEAFRGAPYNDPVGFCTVGYGHLIKKQRCDGSEPVEFLPKITEPVASGYLQSDMKVAEVPVMSAVAVHIALTQAQIDALCDFVFNIGANNFRSSRLLEIVNSGEFHLVPDQFRRWVYASGKKLPGLVKRREREIELFMRGVPRTRGGTRGAGEDMSPLDIGTGKSPEAK